MAKRRLVSKIILFAGVFVVPVFFIYMFSLGSPSYSELPFFGQHTVKGADTTFYKAQDFSFTDDKGQEVNSDTFKDDYLIVSILSKNCPFDCPMPYQQFKYFLYDEIVKSRKKYKDVQFLTHVIDATADELSKLYQDLELDPSISTLVVGEHNAIYDVNLLMKNPWTHPDEKNNYERGAYGLILLLDKQRHIRGVYQANQTSEIKRIENELVLLKREDDREWYKK